MAKEEQQKIIKYIVVVIVLLLLYWYTQMRVTMPSAIAEGRACPMPPVVQMGDVPLQTKVPGYISPFLFQSGAVLEPLAGFSVNARVLSVEHYSRDNASIFSHVDLALGWKKMSETKVLDKLDISQSGRFYWYRWSNEPPIPQQEIINSSANMHMIPANIQIAKALKQVKKDDQVTISGWLVQASYLKGNRAMSWNSSTTREDTGNGACEVIYVCRVERRKRTW